MLLFFFIAIVAFQPVLYASGSRGGANDNVLLAEFGPGGKPNGALVMYASPRCLHRTWYLGDLSAAVGAAASRGVTAASLAGSAFAAASGVQLDASADSVAGPVCIEQWPRTFMLPLLALIFITIANDGAVISIARDRVRAPAAPVQWRLARQTLVALVLAGVSALASGVGLAWFTTSLAHARHARHIATPPRAPCPP